MLKLVFSVLFYKVSMIGLLCVLIHFCYRRKIIQESGLIEISRITSYKRFVKVSEIQIGNKFRTRQYDETIIKDIFILFLIIFYWKFWIPTQKAL